MGENTRQSDEELMLSVQKGNMAAFEALYDRYNKRLFHFILRFVRERFQAEDILQEAFLRVLRARNNYRKGYQFSTYLFTIGRNLCLDTLKSWERRHLLKNKDDYIERVPDQSKDIRKVMEETEMKGILKNEINTLSSDQREVLLLSKYSGLSHGEIAQIVKSTPAAVKQKVYRAMVSLKERLKNLDEKTSVTF